jgi:hypothetical protein
MPRPIESEPQTQRKRDFFNGIRPIQPSRLIAVERVSGPSLNRIRTAVSRPIAGFPCLRHNDGMAISWWVVLVGVLIVLSPLFVIGASRFLGRTGWQITFVAAIIGAVGLIGWNVVVILR